MSNAPAAQFLIRKAVLDDVDALARIWYFGWLDGHTGNVPPELVRYRGREQFVPRMRDRIPSTWVAESEGRAVGFVVVKEDEVDQLYVEAAARGTGVAAKLLQQGEDEIGRAGYLVAWLAVVVGNGRARSFYTRQGWRDAGPMEYLAETVDGPIAVPTHRYEKGLGAPVQ